MAHELVQIFPHVGADKDRLTWKVFSQAEPEPADGLAESDDREYGRSIENSMPNVLRAFIETAAHLPEPYRRHER